MTAYQCSIGHPWIMDILAKYKKNVKYKPVTAQVVEFVKMSAMSSDDSQGVAAVVHISDRKYYIRGIITKEAQVILEREDEHFTLGDIKNKIIILKNYNVVFTAVEDLNSCEFSITVHHFSILPMETNSVDLLNCNMNPAVRRKIKELWQNYMAEQAMNASSADMSLSEISLTQLLNIACEERLSALKSLAEQCLDIDQPSNQDTPQAMTRWGEEIRKNTDANKFNIPLDLLLISPDEEAALEQITGATVQHSSCNDTYVSSEMDDAIAEHHSEKEPSSPSYSTALSTQSDDYFDDVPATQSVNPWNKLQPLSLTLSSVSQAKASSSEAQQNTDEDTLEDSESGESIAQTLLGPSVRGSSGSQQESSPLIFSDRMCRREAIEESSDIHETVTTQRQNVSSNSGLTSGQRKVNSDRTTSPPLLLPLNRISLSSIAPIKRQSSPKRLCSIILSDSESEPSHSSMKPLVCPEETAKKHEDKRECYPLRGRKAKRKTFFSDSDTSLSDAESPNLEYEPVQKMEQNKFESNVSLVGQDLNVPKLVGEDLNVPDTHNEAEKASSHMLGGKDRGNHCLFIEKKQCKEEGAIRRVLNPKLCTKKSPNKTKHSWQSIESTRSKGENAKIESARASTTKQINASAKNQARNTRSKDIQLTLDFSNTNMVHYDGTPFQYTYTTPSAELCSCVDTIRLPADLCEWARKILLEPEKLVS
ncbi:telomere end-binding protein PTOP [Xenopus laevis]|uniref:Telomere end-binding protein PTOP n=1 Tax=Xenopus laevis TaxID=8355 RepID=Q5GA91_XENLA|nr:ACD shelterin complex subunit and telomerase recruitment factorL homeolog [Xenopus laevis]AAW69302.1 telomere end-binding protein PTOP [Xenopus laevis]